MNLSMHFYYYCCYYLRLCYYFDCCCCHYMYCVVCVLQSVEGEYHEKAVELLKLAQGRPCIGA